MQSCSQPGDGSPHQQHVVCIISFFSRKTWTERKSEPGQAIANSQTTNRSLGRNMTASHHSENKIDGTRQTIWFQVESLVNVWDVLMGEGVQIMSISIYQFPNFYHIQNNRICCISCTGNSVFMCFFPQPVTGSHGHVSCTCSTACHINKTAAYIPVGYKAFTHNMCPCDVPWKAAAEVSGFTVLRTLWQATCQWMRAKILETTQTLLISLVT